MFLQLDSPIVSLSGFDVGICRFCSVKVNPFLGGSSFLSGPIECIEHLCMLVSLSIQFSESFLNFKFGAACWVPNFAQAQWVDLKDTFTVIVLPCFSQFYHVLPCFIWYWNLGQITSYNHDIWDLMIKLSAAWPKASMPRPTKSPTSSAVTSASEMFDLTIEV